MIRVATHSDIPILMHLVQDFFSRGELEDTGLELDSDTIEFFIQDMIDLPDKIVLVADIDYEIVGAIAGMIAPWMFNANILTLVEMGWFVPKENRKKYPVSAMALKNRLSRWGKENGATVLIMSSTKREESPRVMQYFEKCGLRHTDSNFIGRL